MRVGRENAKNSSRVAKLSYQLKKSRETATDGRLCVKKLTGTQGDAQAVELAESLRSLKPDEDLQCSDPELSDIGGAQKIATDDTKPADSLSTEDVVVTGGKPGDANEELLNKTCADVKSEEDDDTNLSRKKKQTSTYTAEEDDNLRKGIAKYGKSNWARILSDPELHFKKGRTRDGLRMRATTLKLVKKKKRDKKPKQMASD